MNPVGFLVVSREAFPTWHRFMQLDADVDYDAWIADRLHLRDKLFASERQFIGNYILGSPTARFSKGDTTL